MRDASDNLAMRWFAGYGMADALPDHSSLTRIRQRWGSERFRAIFVRVVKDCLTAGVVSGDVVHMDATLIRADVSLGSLVAQHLDAVDVANPDEDNRLSRKIGKFKKLCVTDPDASMATSAAGRQLLPSNKQHTSGDDRAGAIVDIEVVTGEEADFSRMAERLDALEVTLDRYPGTATMGTAHRGACIAPARPSRTRRRPPIIGVMWGSIVIAALQNFQGVFADTIDKAMLAVDAA